MAQTALQATIIDRAKLDASSTPVQLALFGTDGLQRIVPKQAATQATFAGADITALKVELNAFLAKLKAAGIVAP